MPFQPEKFLYTARNLYTANSEHDLRTAVGRSYYAVFGVVRELVASKGIELPGRSEHNFLYELLKAQTEPKLKELGHDLRRLFTKRVTADYDFGATVTEDDAADAYELARDILADVQAIEAGPRFDIKSIPWNL